MFAILPDQGGISSSYNALEIVMEILTPTNTYKLHTIEVTQIFFYLNYNGEKSSILTIFRYTIQKNAT